MTEAIGAEILRRLDAKAAAAMRAGFRYVFGRANRDKPYIRGFAECGKRWTSRSTARSRFAACRASAALGQGDPAAVSRDAGGPRGGRMNGDPPILARYAPTLIFPVHGSTERDGASVTLSVALRGILMVEPVNRQPPLGIGPQQQRHGRGRVAHAHLELGDAVPVRVAQERGKLGLERQSCRRMARISEGDMGHSG